MKVLAHQDNTFFLIVATKNTRTLVINNDLKSVYSGDSIMLIIRFTRIYFVK